MNKFSVETGSTGTYLVYEFLPEEEIDTLSLGMLMNNKISNVIPIVFTQIDSSKIIKYNISSKITLAQFFNGVVNKKRLLTVFSSILKAITQATEYMIDSSSFMIDMEHIYVDVSTCQAHMLCMPLMEFVDTPFDLSSFFKNIVFNTQFDQTENTNYVVKLISYLNGATTISIDDFSKFVNELLYGQQEQKPAPSKPEVQQPVKQEPVKEQVQKPVVANTVPATPQKDSPVKVEEKKPVIEIPTPAKTVGGFAVPGGKTVKTEKEPAKEKKGGLFGFMKKDDEKSKKAEKQEKPKKQPKEKVDKKNNKATQNKGFNIPGQTAPNKGFSIPGKEQPSNSSSGSVQTVNTPQKAEVTPTPSVTPVAPVSTPSFNFGETTVLGGGAIGETTVLNPDAMPKSQAYLIRKKNNEKIILDKDVFKLGKERNFVDYFIGDNTAISRSHANIISRNGEYFVVDTNSTNHTYINGMMLLAGTESKVNSGDIIRLANEEFTFYFG